MIPTTIYRHHPSSSWAACLTTVALFVGLSLSGCVKSPRDLVSSWRGGKAPLEESADEEGPSTDKGASIADASDSDSPSGLKTASVSRSKSNPGLPQQEFGSNNLMDRLLGRRESESDKNRTTTDPFIDSDHLASAARQKASATSSKSETEVKRRAATLEELLAQTKPAASRKPKVSGETRTASLDTDRRTTRESARETANAFATGFDSRLDRLKADLQSEGAASLSQAADEVNPFAEFVAAKDAAPKTTADADRSLVSSVSFERNRSHEQRLRDEHPLNGITRNAKDRVQTLLNQAHEDWDSWRLEEAYRKTLAAQELAVLEGVQFDVSDERPSDLAKRIASEIRKDSLSSTSSNPKRKVDVWTDEPASHDDAFSEVASRTFASFTAGSPMIGWQSVVPKTSAKQPATQRAERNPEIEPASSGRSGVNLLPPSSDDFPSDAEDREWQKPTSSEMTNADTHHTSSHAIVNLAWPEETHPTPNTTTDNDTFGSGPALVRYDTNAHEPTEQSLPEEGEDFLAHVAANRDRVLQSELPQWPTLPAPDATGANRRDAQSVQVAVAPPVFLGLDAPKTSTVATIAPGSATQASVGGAPLATVWYSRPLWFIGGLVLLMLSMRLLSRRSTTHA